MHPGIRYQCSAQALTVFKCLLIMTKPRSLALCLTLALSINAGKAQLSNFLDQLRFGFGAGSNVSIVTDLSPFNIFEDMEGNSYLNEYTPLFENFGNQYFVQAEWAPSNFIITLKPGTYTSKFAKRNEIVFSEETITQTSPYLLRYFSIPLEIRYNLDLQRFRPYVGAGIAYSQLMGSHDAANQTFIRPRFTGGAALGTYIDLRYIILDLNAAYRHGLHNITRKEARFETGSGSTFAQDDILLNDLQLSLSILFSLQKQKHYSNVECFY